jgi:multidrug resistance efflux pump
VEQETDRVRLQRLGVQLARYEKLLAERLVDEAIYDETRIEHDATETRLRENASALAIALARREEAEARLAEQRAASVPSPALETFLAPIRDAVSLQESVISEVRERRMVLALRAPISGQISRILQSAGETVLSGTPLLMVSDPASRRVLAYLHEGTSTLPNTGDVVEVVARRLPKQVMTAEVVRVGLRVEEMPPHLWSNPMMVQRGIPLLVGNLSANHLLPGEVVDLRFSLGTAGVTMQ